MTPATPSVKSQSNSPLQRSRCAISSGMPLLLPFYQFSSFSKLRSIEARSHACQGDVLNEEIQRIHVELGGHVVEGRKGEPTGLRMVRCPPSSLCSYVRHHCCVNFSLVRNIKHVRNRGHAAARQASGSPRLGLPGNQGPVLLCSNLDLGVMGRTSSSDEQLCVALQERLNRTSGLLRQMSRLDPPSTCSELTAEATANMVHTHLDVAGRDLQRLGILSSHTGNVLS